MNLPEAPLVVAATDFSDAAQQAVERAARLAAQQGGRVTLLHVVNHDWLDAVKDLLAGDGSWNQRLLDEARGQLQRVAEEISASHRVDVSSLLLDGQPVSAIEQAVREAAGDLLVLGARGRTPVHQLLVGTTAERLLRKASRPILMVRRAAQGPYRKVLVPVDFSGWSGAAVALALSVAPGAELVLMHTYTVPFEEKLRFAGVDPATIDIYRDKARRQSLERLQSLAAQHGLTPESYSLCIREGDAAPRLVSEAADRGCDLVVIGKHGRHAAEELLLGSVTKHVLVESPCDVLVSTKR